MLPSYLGKSISEIQTLVIFGYEDTIRKKTLSLKHMLGNWELEGGLPLPGVGAQGEVFRQGKMSCIFKIESVGGH